MATDLPPTTSPLDREPAEPKKPSVQILNEEIDEAMDALERPATGLFLSGLSAGLDIGFSLFLIAVVRTLANGELSEQAWVAG